MEFNGQNLEVDYVFARFFVVKIAQKIALCFYEGLTGIYRLRNS